MWKINKKIILMFLFIITGLVLLSRISNAEEVCTKDQSAETMNVTASSLWEYPLAQSFKPSRPGLCKVSVWLYKSNSPGDIMLYLRSEINGTNIVEKRIYNDTVPTDPGGWVNLSFDQQLTTGETYWIVLKCLTDSCDLTNNYGWPQSNTSYVNGTGVDCQDADCNTTFDNEEDFMFMTYANESLISQPTNTSVEANPETVQCGDKSVINVTVKNDSTPVPCGNVGMTADSGTFDSNLLTLSNGQASTNWTAPATIGTFDIFGDFNSCLHGNVYYEESSGNTTVQVTGAIKATITTVKVSKTDLNCSESILVEVNVNDSEGNPATGNVSLSANSGWFDSPNLTLDQNGYASTYWNSNYTGDFQINATYEGNIVGCVEYNSSVGIKDVHVDFSHVPTSTYVYTSPRVTMTNGRTYAIAKVQEYYPPYDFVNCGNVSLSVTQGSLENSTVNITDGFGFSRWFMPSVTGQFNVTAQFNGCDDGCYIYDESQDENPVFVIKDEDDGDYELGLEYTTNYKPVRDVIDQLFPLGMVPGTVKRLTDNDLRVADLNVMWDETSELWKGVCLDSVGWSYCYNASNDLAWETDLKRGDLGGDNNNWVDDVDFVYLGGHGVYWLDDYYNLPLRSVLFNNENDGFFLEPGDVRNAMGDKDLEWLTIHSCSIMSYDNYWANAFNGAHLILGYKTTTYGHEDFGEYLAALMTQTSPFDPPFTITQSWFITSDLTQPLDVIAEVIAPGTEAFNDYLWGEGNVSIDKNLGDKFWRIERKVSKIIFADAGGPYYGVNNTPVQFDGSMSYHPIHGYPLRYLWRFGDGGTEIGPFVNHTFTTTGNFSVNLTLRDDRWQVLAEDTTWVNISTSSSSSSSMNLYEVMSPENVTEMMVYKVIKPNVTEGYVRYLGGKFNVYDLFGDDGSGNYWLTNPGSSNVLMVNKITGSYAYVDTGILFRDLVIIPDLLPDDLAIDSALNFLGSDLPDDAYLDYVFPDAKENVNVTDGEIINSILIDKQVAFKRMINDSGTLYPVVGPGGKIKVYEWDKFMYEPIGVIKIWRDIEPYQTINIISEDEALSLLNETGYDFTMYNMIEPNNGVIVRDVKLGYYEGSFSSDQDYINPVYIVSVNYLRDNETISDEIYVPAWGYPPRVSITSPSEGSTFMKGSLINFSSSVINGTPPHTYEWISDIDGYLGDESTLNISSLSSAIKGSTVVNQTITLRVTDSKGLVGSDSIRITISVGNLIDSLSDGSKEKNLTFTSAGEQVDYLKIPKNANVASAKMDLTGFGYQVGVGELVFSDNFDDGDISDWTVTTTGDATFDVSSSKYVSSPYSVHMKSLGSYKAMGVSPSYDLNLSEDYDVSLYFLIPHTNNHWFEVFNNRQTYLVIDLGSDLKCYLGNLTSLMIMPLGTNQWYNIEIKVHQSSNNYDVYVNDTFKRTCPMWIHGTYNQSFRIGDRADGSTDKGEAYWDDITIYQGEVLVYSYPTNPTLDVGNNTDTEWNYTGIFNVSETTPDFSDELNEHLGYCVPVAGNCAIPLVFNSSSAGIIEISNIRIYYTILGNITLPNIAISSPQNCTDYPNCTNSSYYKLKIPLNFTVDNVISYAGYSLDEGPEVNVTDNTTYNGTHTVGYEKFDASDGYHNITVIVNGDSSDPVYFFYCKGDVNKDKVVNIIDVVKVAIVYGNECGDEDYDPVADLNDDCDINIVDVVIVAIEFGKTC